MPVQTHTIIRGGRVLDRAARAAPPADILVAGDSIAEIGPPGMAAPEGARPIDATGRLLMPGLVNAHTHGHGALAKGMGDIWNLELLLNAGPYLNGHRSLEDKYLSGLLGGLDLIRSGATSCYDLFFEFPLPSLDGLAAAARGYAEAGVRVVMAPMVADRTMYEAIPGLVEALPPALAKEVERFRLAPAAETLAAMRRILAGWRGPRDAAAIALGPTIPLHCSDAFTLGCRDLAREFGTGLHMHLAESRPQAVAGIRRYGKTLTAHLAELDVLAPNFVGAHAVWLDDDDIQRLADRGCTVAHNPGSNMRLGSGVAPARRMRRRGLAVGIGTDGASCSDNQNMFEAMRLASFASRLVGTDYHGWLRTEEVLAMATEGSARALGWEDRIGRLAPGFKADIVFLDLEHPNWLPHNDPVNQLVHTENGGAVDSVMVGGRMVLDRGRFPGIDLAALRRKVEDRVAELKEKTRELKTLAHALEELVGHYCVGLAREPYHVERLIPEGGGPSE
jgi:5-methylthioadenosine/S-adenosylhomocysteine deaminase